MGASVMPVRVRSDIDPFSSEYILDPYPFHEQLRQAGPVVWLDRWDVFATARYEHVHAVLSDARSFCSSAGVGIQDLRSGQAWRSPSLLLETDPPDHTANRAIVGKVLSPLALRALRATFEAEADLMVERVLASGTIEAISDLAEAFPMKVFADSVGVPTDGREHLVAWGNMVFNGMGPRNALFDQAMANANTVSQWVVHACRRDVLSGTGFGAQIYASVDAGLIDETHAALLVRAFLSAGIDTTTYAIASALFCFANHPEQWQRLRSDATLVKPAFEEIMRFESPFQTFFRTATCEVDLGGTSIPKDSKVMVSIGAANRDPDRWPDPDRFDIARNTKGHVGFGTGIHGCVGQMVARLEVETLLIALTKKVKRFDIVGEPIRQLHNTLRGFERLPLRLVA